MPPKRVGLVIVHGIGDPSPGDALRDLTDGLIAEQVATFDATVLERRLPDVSLSPDKLAFFPVRLRRGVLKNGAEPELIAAEVFWGSASQLAAGRWGVLQGTASLLLNVPTLVMGARRTGGLSAFVSWWSSMLLASAAFALNAYLMLTLGVYIALCYAIGRPPGRWETVAPVVAAAATYALSRGHWFWFREARESFKFVGIVCLAPWVLTSRTLEGFAGVVVPLLTTVIAVVAALVLLVGVLFLGAQLTRRAAAGSVTGTLTLCLQFGLWTLIIPLAWQALFALVPNSGQQPWMVRLFADAAASNGLQWVLAGVVMIAFGVVAVLRHRQASASAQALQPDSTLAQTIRPADRLILHPILATTLFLCVMAGAAVILLGTLGAPWIQPLRQFSDRLGSARVAAGVLVAVPLLTIQLRAALDLAYDVMLYLYYATEPKRRVLGRSRGLEIGNNPIRRRFKVIVDHLVRDEEVAHLFVVAHSQGTVVALEELTHSWDKTTEPLPPVTFVTFGSPISVLYQHYFPGIFPAWTDDQWQVLFTRLDRWVNLYTLDDYVGTTIDYPEPLGRRFVQTAIGRGGHTGYWRDRRFFAALKTHAFSLWVPSGSSAQLSAP